MPDVETRFWARVKKTDGCWLWTGHTTAGGYGQFKPYGNEKNAQTHRYAYELAHGPIPEGFCVCHSCDVNYLPGDITYRRCVRDDHLWLGTQLDNVADMVAKARAARGDRSGARRHPESHVRGAMSKQAKLSEDTVRDIRTELASGKTRASVARERDVVWRTIALIADGRTWAHVR